MGKLDDYRNSNIPYVTLVKKCKEWGIEVRETEGQSFNVQIPSTEDLEKARLQKGVDCTRYTYTSITPLAVIEKFNTFVGLNEPVYDIDLSLGNGGVWNITVTKYYQKPILEGHSEPDEVDYGSDGEGNIDYDDWSTQKTAKVTAEKWYLAWEDVTDYPPFAQYGVQYISPSTLTAYVKLKQGFKPGDMISIPASAYPRPIKSYSQQQPIIPDHPIPDPGYNEVLQLLYQEKVLILVHTWSKQWVISKSHFKANKELEDMTEKEHEEYDKRGILVSTLCRPNEDGNRRENRDGTVTVESNSYTVTRTWTFKKEWKNVDKGELPIGLKLVEPPMDPNP